MEIFIILAILGISAASPPPSRGRRLPTNETTSRLINDPRTSWFYITSMSDRKLSAISRHGIEDEVLKLLTREEVDGELFTDDEGFFVNHGNGLFLQVDPENKNDDGNPYVVIGQRDDRPSIWVEVEDSDTARTICVQDDVVPDYNGYCIYTNHVTSDAVLAVKEKHRVQPTMKFEKDEVP